MKALRIHVYRDNLGDCTNEGISSKYNDLLLICENGYIEIDENNLPENLVEVVEGFKGYKYLRPYKKADKDKTGYMMGGNYAGSSDSRFCQINQYPLPIHDRQETWEQYDMLTR